MPPHRGKMTADNLTWCIAGRWAPLLALGGEFWEERVASACDVCLDYIALEPRLFTLGISDAYRALHHVSQERSNQTGRGKVRGGAERDLEVLSRVVECLYNVLSTCHLRPIIRAQRGLRPALTFNMPNRDGLLQFGTGSMLCSCIHFASERRGAGRRDGCRTCCNQA